MVGVPDLRAIPPFVTAGTFCTSQDGLKSSGFLMDGTF